jgi:hypothetical protein
MKDPLPALVSAIDLIEVTHANDKLARMALENACNSLARGHSTFSVAVALTSARDTMRDLGRLESMMVLDLALDALRL